MDNQNEWVVQGKRKNRKRKKTKKSLNGDGNNASTQNDANKSAPTEPPSQENVINHQDGKKCQEKNLLDLTNTNGQQKPTKIETLKIEQSFSASNISQVENIPISSNASSLTSENVQGVPNAGSPIVSHAEQNSSSVDSQTKPNQNSTNEKHPTRLQTTSGSGHEVIKKSSKDLQRSSVSIARYQSMLDEEADSSVKMLAKSFQAIRNALDEREKILEEQLKSVITEAREMLEERQQDAVCLQFKCKGVSSMTAEDVAELRNEIKHFVGERRIDEDLGKTARFTRDEEKMLEMVKNFGEVPSIKDHYTKYKRKLPESAGKNLSSHKTATYYKTKSSKNEISASEIPAKEMNNKEKDDKQVALSPSRLKYQAEMHAKLQQAVKEQQGSSSADEFKRASSGKNGDKPVKGRDFVGRAPRHNDRRVPNSRSKQKQINDSKNHFKSSENKTENKANNQELGNKAKSKTIPHGESEGRTLPTPASTDKIRNDQTVSLDGTQATPNGHHVQENSMKPEETSSHLGNGNHQPKRTKRKYVRKTLTNDGAAVFCAGTVDPSSNNVSFALINVQKNDDSTASNQANSEVFVPLPQRSGRPRGCWMKKESANKIQFPPSRENKSIPA
ncbi:SPATS2-like protein isoform X2 [Xenia sp. Carnegie-2017]|nr:SPATS2-like protein isoform X2 [Xenia sp. Carnegie-2017]